MAKRIVVMEVNEDAMAEVSVFYVEEALHAPMVSVLNSMGILYESQVVSEILPEDGDDWLPVTTQTIGKSKNA